jgi:hypothetical protein
MEKLRQMAFLSVGRAVGFGGLGIATLMAGLSFDPVLALKCGGTLLLLLLAVLLLKAQLPASNFRATETWLLLDKQDRPDERYAGLLVSNVLRDTYLWFARWTAGLASVLWILALMLAWLGVGAELSVEPEQLTPA